MREALQLQPTACARGKTLEMHDVSQIYYKHISAGDISFYGGGGWLAEFDIRLMVG